MLRRRAGVSASQFANLQLAPHLQSIVEILKDLNLGLGAICPQVDAAQGDADVRVGGAATENENHALVLEQALDADERFGSGEVNACCNCGSVSKQPKVKRATRAERRRLLTTGHTEVEHEEPYRVLAP